MVPALHYHKEQLEQLKRNIEEQGFAKVPSQIFALNPKTIQILRDELEALFDGNYSTGIYPDEIHWRPGISREDVTRELCNAWKASDKIQDLVCGEALGRLACLIMGWSSSRIGQDDVLHKPPQSNAVGFHQDGSYISDNFLPRHNNMLTMWIALDDADEENGALRYVPVSHLWEDETSAVVADSVAGSSFHVGKKQDPMISLRRAAHLAGKDMDQVEESVVTISVPDGQMVVHHQDVWHGSGPNRSHNRPRRAIVAHMLNGQVQWRQNRIPHYIYGRYYLRGESIPREDFFPVTFSCGARAAGGKAAADAGSALTRTHWLDEKGIGF